MTAVIAYFRDFGGEVVSTGIPCQVTSDNAERQAVLDAIQLWSAGENDGGEEVLQLEARVGSSSNSPLAQSAYYGYFVFKDNVNGKTYKERLPMPDTAKAVDGDGDTAWVAISDPTTGRSVSHINQNHADWATLKTAMEAAYVSPNDNTAELVDVYIPTKY